MRRHGCRRGKHFEGCETPPTHWWRHDGKGQARPSDVTGDRDMLGTARQSNVVNLESGIELKDARGRARAQAAEGARNPKSGAAQGRDCTVTSWELETATGGESRHAREFGREVAHASESRGRHER